MRCHLSLGLRDFVTRQRATERLTVTRQRVTERQTVIGQRVTEGLTEGLTVEDSA